MTSKKFKKIVVSSLLDSQSFVTKAVPHFFSETFTRRPRGIGALGVVGIAAASTAIGAGLALLFSPKKGSEIRETIVNGVKDLRATTESKGKEAAAELKNGAARAKAEGNSVSWSAS